MKYFNKLAKDWVPRKYSIEERNSINYHARFIYLYAKSCSREKFLASLKRNLSTIYNAAGYPLNDKGEAWGNNKYYCSDRKSTVLLIPKSSEMTSRLVKGLNFPVHDQIHGIRLTNALDCLIQSMVHEGHSIGTECLNLLKEIPDNYYFSLLLESQIIDEVQSLKDKLAVSGYYLMYKPSTRSVSQATTESLDTATTDRKTINLSIMRIWVDPKTEALKTEEIVKLQNQSQEHRYVGYAWFRKGGIKSRSMLFRDEDKHLAMDDESANQPHARTTQYKILLHHKTREVLSMYGFSRGSYGVNAYMTRKVYMHRIDEQIIKHVQLGNYDPDHAPENDLVEAPKDKNGNILNGCKHPNKGYNPINHKRNFKLVDTKEQGFYRFQNLETLLEV